MMERGSSGMDMAIWACVKLSDTTINPYKLVPISTIRHFPGEKIEYNNKVYNLKYERKWKQCQICFVTATYEEAKEKMETQRMHVRPFNAKLLSASEISGEGTATDAQSGSDKSPQVRTDNSEEKLEEILEKRKMSLIQKQEHRIELDEREDKSKGRSSPKTVDALSDWEEPPQEKEKNHDETSLSTDVEKLLEYGEVDQPTPNEFEAKTGQNEKCLIQKQERQVELEEKDNKSKEKSSPRIMEALSDWEEPLQEKEENNNGSSIPTEVEKLLEHGKAGQSRVNEFEVETGQKRKSAEKKRKRESRNQESCKGECTAEIKKLRREVERTSNLCTEMLNLLKAVHGNWEQVKATEPQNSNDMLGNFSIDPKPGFIKHDENGIKIIHLGRGIWLSEKEFNEIAWGSASTPIFVKNLGMKLFGEDTLKGHSVSGMAAPRTGEQKPPLDATKCLAIQDAYGVYLEKFARWTNENEIIQEINNVGHYLQEKIVDLNRKPRLKPKRIMTKSSKSITRLGNGSSDRKIRKKLKESGCRGRKDEELVVTSSSDDEEQIQDTSKTI